MNDSFVRTIELLKNQRLHEVIVLSRRRNKEMEESENLEKGKLSVSEAGKRGGAKGGPRVRELIREGKEHEEE
jgi:hypothetical protein